jgi:hypothetical protein
MDGDPAECVCGSKSSAEARKVLCKLLAAFQLCIDREVLDDARVAANKMTE